MALLILQDVVGRQVDGPQTLDPRRKRLSTIVARHADRSRPFIVSVCRPGQAVMPADDTVVLRGEWRRTLVPRNATVVITYVPMGGGGSGGGNNTGKAIGGALAMIALAVVAPYAVGALGGAFVTAAGGLSMTGKIVAAGIVMGGGYLISKATQAKANKQDSSSEPLYGVSGGGNMPQPGGRIPVGYGQFWTQPDLSQPDYIINDGEDQVLYKRMTLGLGRYEIERINVGQATLWTPDGGIHSTFVGGEVEIIPPGGTSSLVPGTVISASDVGGAEIARKDDAPNPDWSGPWPVTPPGIVTKKIQIDFSLPYGCYMNWNKNGNQFPIWYDAWFEYVQIDNNNNPIGSWQLLYRGNEQLNTTRAQRFTRIIDVPEGRYAVRAQNTQPKEYIDQYGANRLYNDLTWDGLRAPLDDTIIRPDVTEIAVKIRSGKTLVATSFADIWVRATRVLPVWNGSAWSEQPTRKAVWAWCDVMRAAYGGNLLDSQIDVSRALHYAGTLTALDTFDGIIRGPVSVHEAASTVLGVIRADPVRIGNTWSIGRDEPRAVAKHLFTRRQIVRDSSQAHFQVSRDDGQADVIVEYYQDSDSRRRREVRATFGTASLTPRRYSATGVSTYEHAHHLATWMAAAAYYRRERRTITVEHEGRLVSRGDPARVDVWYMSDAVAAGVMGQSGTTITLDTDVVAAGKYAIFRNRRNREWGPVAVTQGADAQTVVLNGADVAAAEASSGLSLGNICDDNGGDMVSVLIGPLTELQDAYIIDSAAPQGRDRVTIEAVRDSDAVWAAIGQPMPPEPDIPSRGDMELPAVPVIPWLRAAPIQKTNSLDMEWAVGVARGAVRYVVRLSYDDGATWEAVSDGPATSGTYTLRYVEGMAAKVEAFAVNDAGVQGPTVHASVNTYLPVVDFDLGAGAVDWDALSEQIRYEISQITKRGEDLLDWLDGYFEGIELPTFDWARAANTFEELDRKIQAMHERLAAAEATTTAKQQVNVDRIKVELTKGDTRNWAAIERVDEARISDKEAFTQTTNSMAAQLEDVQADIIEEKTVRATETEALASVTTSLQSQINDPDTGLSAAASAIDTLQTRVTSTEDGITAVSNRTTELESEINDPATGLNAVASAYDNLETRVELTEDGIETVSTRTTELGSRLTDAETGLDATASAVDTLQTRVTQTEDGITSTASRVTALESNITSGFVAERAWDFGDNVAGWSNSQSAGLGHNASVGAMVITKQATTHYVWFPGLDISTETVPQLKIRYRRVSGSNSGPFVVRFATTGSANEWSANNRIELPAPTVNGEWVERQVDILPAAPGYHGRLTMLMMLPSDGVGTGSQFQIDYIAVGRPGVSATASAYQKLETRVTDVDGVVTSQAQAITALESTVNDPVTGLGATATAVDEMETRVDATETGISAVGTRVSALESKSESVFVAERAWDFGADMIGWSNSASSGVWVDTAIGALNITKQSTSHNVYYSGLNISTSLVPQLKIRYRRVSGSNSGPFVVRFKTTGSTNEWSANNRIELPAPTVNNEWVERTVDIATAAPGYHGNLTLVMMLPSDGVGTGSQFQVDYIAFGRPGAAVSAGAYERVETRIDVTGAQVTAVATRTSVLEADVDGQRGAITGLKEVVSGPDGLTAQYGVSLDLGGQVQGGYKLLGVRRNDGTGGTVKMIIDGDLTVNGSITGNKLIANQAVIQNNTQMGSDTIGTATIIGNSVTQSYGVDWYRDTNSQNAPPAIEMTVRQNARIAVICSFHHLNPNAIFVNTQALGEMGLYINESLVQTVPLYTAAFGDGSGRSCMGGMLIATPAVAAGFRWFRVQRTDESQNVPGNWRMIVMELAR